MMKKILCFIDNLSSGGAQRQMVVLASLLKERGYSVKLITYYPLDFYLSILKEANVDYENIDKAQNKYLRIFYIYDAIKKYNPDVVISYLNTPSIIACLCKILGCKAKLIVSERNTTQKLTLSEKIKFLFYRVADYIVPNSYSQENFIKENYKNLALKTITITNFTDTDIFKPTNNIDCVGNNIICVGRVTPQKNVLRLLDVLNQLKIKGVKFSVKWFGRNDEKYYSQCIDKVNQLNLTDVISFEGASKNIVAEYNKSSVFCLPSIYEGFPNVLCEAMACGLPILCSNICDNAYIAQDGENGYIFNPFSEDDMLDAFEKFFVLSDLQRQKMANKSRVIAVEKFKRDVFVDKYIDLIEG